MSVNCCVAIFLILFGLTITARSVPANNEAAKLSFKEHQQRTKAFGCSVPQQRSYKILKILEHGKVGSHETIKPENTVVRRCDAGTGCCVLGGQTCAPSATIWEDVEVKVSWFVDGSTSMSKMKTLRIEHHLNCSCQLLNSTEIVSSEPNIILLD